MSKQYNSIWKILNQRKIEFKKDKGNNCKKQKKKTKKFYFYF